MFPDNTWRLIMKNLTPWLSQAIVLALCSVQAAGQYTWTKDVRNPVLVGGNAGQWNAHIAQPCVLYNTDSSRYEMWFVGFTGAPGPNYDYHPYKIGYAWSIDGISWTMYPSPVLSPTANTWDAYTTDAPMVIREKGQYKMWYASFLSPTSPGYLGYATSPDGISWTKYSGNPVMAPGKAAWEVAGPYCCSIIPVPGGYRMWYGGVDGTFVTDNIDLPPVGVPVS
jgi:beta-1,2-mannobiose phosphorylase / 1,2-beta-oligomannan phosphorylase